MRLIYWLQNIYVVIKLTFSDPCKRLPNESKTAYNAFLEYKSERKLEIAYNNFMQNNSEALTSMKGFLKWASQFNWQKRVNDYDAMQDMFTQRETRLKSREYAFTAETIAEELYTCCMEEMRLKQGDMTHKDIAKYMDICQKIGDKWDKPDVSPVTVNVDQNVSQTVKTEAIDPEMAAEIGKAMALKASQQIEEVKE